MNNVARACIFGSLAFTTSVAMLMACEDGQFVGPWPLAPSGGLIADAAGGSGSGGTILDGGTTSNDGSPGSTSNPDASADAGDGAAVVAPYPSVTIAAGIGFGCHIDGQGNVWCWGNNEFGQAGTTPSASVSLQQVAGVTGATAIALGDYHACAVTSSNTVLCWGLNNSYQLGHQPSQGSGDVSCPGTANQPIPCNATPSTVAGVSAVAVAASGAWTCTVGLDSSVQCWGAVQGGGVAADGGSACGDGTAASGGTCYAGPYAVGLSGVTQLSIAFDHVCALVQDGGVSCWGSNSEDQVTHGYCPDLDCAPVVQPLLPAATSVAVGASFSCAIAVDGGAVSCFGDNAYGELGHTPGTMGDPSPGGGALVYNYEPLPVGGIGAVAELVASGSPASQAACAIIGGGAVECWGNVVSDAGGGVPVTISGLPPMLSLGVPDSTYACGVGTDGTVWCWSLASGAAPAQVQ